MWANEDAYFARFLIIKTWKSSNHAYYRGLVQKNAEHLKGPFFNVSRGRITGGLVKAQIPAPHPQTIKFPGDTERDFESCYLSTLQSAVTFTAVL